LSRGGHFPTTRQIILLRPRGVKRFFSPVDDVDDGAGLEALDGGFDDLLGGEAVFAGAFELVVGDARADLLEPAMDAVLEGVIEAAETAEEVVAQHAEL